MDFKNVKEWVNKNKGTLLACVIAAMIAFILGLVVNKPKSVENTQESKVAEAPTEETSETKGDGESVQSLDTVIEADTKEALSIGGKKASDTVDSAIALQLDKLDEYIETVYSDSGMIFVIVGEEDEEDSGANKIVEAYTPDYKAYVEYYGEVPEFFYKRGRSISMSDIVQRTSNLTTMDILQGIIDIAKRHSDGVSITTKTQDVYENDEEMLNVDAPADAEEIVISDEGVTEKETKSEEERGEYLFTETITTVKIDREKIVEYYKEEFGEDYLDVFDFENIWANAVNDTKEDDFIYFNFVTTNVDNQMGAGEYLVADGTTYISWYFDNHFKLNSWTIDEKEWEASHTVDEFITMAKGVQGEVSSATETLQQELDEMIELYKQEDEQRAIAETGETADENGDGVTVPKSQGSGEDNVNDMELETSTDAVETTEETE